MEGRDPRPDFGAGEKAMYELYERALEKSGNKSPTNSALVATALTLSCTTPTYLITRKVSQMRTAHNLREASQSKEMAKSLPMQPKYKLVIIDGNDPSDIREPLLASAG
jgi:site-specific recombinase XerC